MKRIELVFFDAGGGHRSAATALQTVIERQGRPWAVSLTNLQELLDPLDRVRQLTGIRIQDVYNQMLRKGWTLGSAQLLRILQFSIRLHSSRIVSLLQRHWRESRPDLVVSLVPNFNRPLQQSLLGTFPGRPFVTILTDLADYPPHFWIERQEQFVICGSERAAEQARKLGHPEEHVLLTSGMILHPRFYEPADGNPLAERERLGLRPELSTGLVLFGGHGSRAMFEIARRLDRSSLDIQLIFVCGRNAKLAQRLRGLHLNKPALIEGFTTEIPYYMRLSDFFIGKPGPGSITEALAMKLPLIVECNVRTLPQERYNAQWIRERGLGLVVQNFRNVADAVAELLRADNLARYRENAAALNNRAVFEIPALLEQILNHASPKKEPCGIAQSGVVVDSLDRGAG